METYRGQFTEDFERESYEAYLSLLENSENLIAECIRKESPEPGDLRIFNIDPPFYLLITRKIDDNLYEVIPFTEFWALARTSANPPQMVLRNYKLTLSPLPFKYYFLEELLFNYSCRLIKVKGEDVRHIVKYVETARLDKVSELTRKFFEKETERIGKFSMSSILTALDRLEEEPIVLELPEEAYEREVAYAALGDCFRGENWLGVVENEVLHLYLPQELLGKEISIKYGDKEIFRGALNEIHFLITLKAKYYDLEGKLNVQVL
uniref:Uncharacterized protein n=1 Tax=candidate division WOR-3 bacterium TaxID=2052148 RepID=A0A7C2PE51_UNCW3